MGTFKRPSISLFVCRCDAEKEASPWNLDWTKSSFMGLTKLSRNLIKVIFGQLIRSSPICSYKYKLLSQIQNLPVILWQAGRPFHRKTWPTRKRCIRSESILSISLKSTSKRGILKFYLYCINAKSFFSIYGSKFISAHLFSLRDYLRWQFERQNKTSPARKMYVMKNPGFKSDVTLLAAHSQPLYWLNLKWHCQVMILVEITHVPNTTF